MKTRSSRLRSIRLPLPIRAMNAIGFPVDLTMDGLINAAIKAEKGRCDFGDDSFKTPLAKLLEAIEAEAHLHTFGRFITKQRLVGLLRNRLRAEYYFKKHPEILEMELKPPLVIAGLQRTGTTFLQRLLASSSAFRSLKSWEALNPAPHPGWQKEKSDKRVIAGKLAERGLRYLNPAFFAIHPVEYNAPEEEVLLLDISFLSTVAEATLHVPSFARWLEDEDQSPAYDYMKKLLQLLSWQTHNKRWLLKTPHHLEHLDSLNKTFPQCTIIQTHRDPRVTIPSLCSMIWHGRFIFSNHVDAKQIGAQWLRKVGMMLKKSNEYRQAVNSQNFIDLNYEELVSNPEEVTLKIYDTLGMPLKETGELRTALEKNNRNKYGPHQYTPEDFGLTAEKIQHTLTPYLT